MALEKITLQFWVYDSYMQAQETRTDVPKKDRYSSGMVLCLSRSRGTLREGHASVSEQKKPWLEAREKQSTFWVKEPLWQSSVIPDGSLSLAYPHHWGIRVTCHFTSSTLHPYDKAERHLPSEDACARKPARQSHSHCPGLAGETDSNHVHSRGQKVVLSSEPAHTYVQLQLPVCHAIPPGLNPKGSISAALPSRAVPEPKTAWFGLRAFGQKGKDVHFCQQKRAGATIYWNLN